LILPWIGQLILNLARSFQAIKYLPIEQSPEISIGHGFEPIMVVPMPPAEIVHSTNATEHSPEIPQIEDRSASRRG
jgi:hypothetical protein